MPYAPHSESARADERPVAQHPTGRRSNRLGLAVIALAVPGLFGTVALPAYVAIDPAPSDAEAAAVALEEYSERNAQSFAVSAQAVELTAERSEITATTEAELARQRAAAAAAARAASARVATASAPAPSGALGAIVSIALRYQGVPYVYGGSSPAGFDCSGFTMYVYRQVGISLPHGSRSQAYGGTRIAASAAQPGDLVVLDGGSHIGIYVGGGRMIDAPYPGKTVQVRAIYSSNHWFVRY